jgi:hypothetical protein
LSSARKYKKRKTRLNGGVTLIQSIGAIHR